MINKTLLVGMLLGSALVAFVPLASAQTVVKTAASGQGLSEGGLVERYTPLASGAANAKAMVMGLRKGAPFTLTSTQTVTTLGACSPTPMGCKPGPSTTTTTTVETTITPPDAKVMGWGNVDLTLAIAEAKLGTGVPHAQLKALIENVLSARASGTGWGAIATSMDLKLVE
jgi:hypothetical protein